MEACRSVTCARKLLSYVHKIHNLCAQDIKLHAINITFLDWVPYTTVKPILPERISKGHAGMLSTTNQ